MIEQGIITALNIWFTKLTISLVRLLRPYRIIRLCIKALGRQGTVLFLKKMVVPCWLGTNFSYICFFLETVSHN